MTTTLTPDSPVTFAPSPITEVVIVLDSQTISRLYLCSNLLSTPTGQRPAGILPTSQSPEPSESDAVRTNVNARCEPSNDASSSARTSIHIATIDDSSRPTEFA